MTVPSRDKRGRRYTNSELLEEMLGALYDAQRLESPPKISDNELPCVDERGVLWLTLTNGQRFSVRAKREKA